MCAARSLTKVLFAAFKDKKSSHDDMEKNICFKQLLMNYIQPKKNKKNKKRPVVVKTEDEICVLSNIKIYSYFSFVFSTVSKKVELLKISKVM